MEEWESSIKYMTITPVNDVYITYGFNNRSRLYCDQLKPDDLDRPYFIGESAIVLAMIANPLIDLWKVEKVVLANPRDCNYYCIASTLQDIRVLTRSGLVADEEFSLLSETKKCIEIFHDIHSAHQAMEDYLDYHAPDVPVSVMGVRVFDTHPVNRQAMYDRININIGVTIDGDEFPDGIEISLPINGTIEILGVYQKGVLIDAIKDEITKGITNEFEFVFDFCCTGLSMSIVRRKANHEFETLNTRLINTQNSARVIITDKNEHIWDYGIRDVRRAVFANAEALNINTPKNPDDYLTFCHGCEQKHSRCTCWYCPLCGADAKKKEVYCKECNAGFSKVADDHLV